MIAQDTLVSFIRFIEETEQLKSTLRSAWTATGRHNRPENAVYGFSDDETHPRLIRKDRSRQRRASSWSRA